MFETLRQSLGIGLVTTTYPETPPELSSRARGRPEIDWANWKDARPAASVCPTAAISFQDVNRHRLAHLDLGKCIFCGLCADVDSAIHMTSQCECAVHLRDDLLTRAVYTLKTNGTHDQLMSGPSSAEPKNAQSSPSERGPLTILGEQIKERAGELFGR